MKLKDIAVTNKPSAQKVLERHLRATLKVESLDAKNRAALARRVNGLLEEYRRTRRLYESHQDPTYLKLLMMQQALRARVNEQAGGVPVDLEDPKTQSALTKVQSGGNLSPDEQNIVNAVAAMKKEARRTRSKRMVKESEVAEAQVVLAAQDLVDRVQKMVEETSEMQFKDLPALVDSIRTQIGMDQANAFNTTVSQSLQSLITALQGTKQQLDTAVSAARGGEIAVPGEEMPAEPAEMPAGDMEAELDLDANIDVEEPTEPAATAVGRARRQ